MKGWFCSGTCQSQVPHAGTEVGARCTSAKATRKRIVSSDASVLKRRSRTWHKSRAFKRSRMRSCVSSGASQLPSTFSPHPLVLGWPHPVVQREVAAMATVRPLWSCTATQQTCARPCTIFSRSERAANAASSSAEASSNGGMALLESGALSCGEGRRSRAARPVAARLCC